MSDASAAELILAYWCKRNVHFLQGVNDAEIDRFETAYRVRLSAPVRAFYHVTNGTDVPGTTGQDELSFHFWRLEDIVPDEGYPSLFQFMDYRERSWSYGLNLGDDSEWSSTSIHLLGVVPGKPPIIARSFEDFAELYVRNDPRLYPSGLYTYEHDSQQ